jgi:hypothetical protein
MPVKTRIEKIVSGGQTGVDRAALDTAIALGIPHGGWCPRGRLAEDGTIPARYHLTENSSPEYAARTEQNVRASDGTLVLSVGEPTDGTALTCRLARRHAKPLLVVDLACPPEPEKVWSWIVTSEIGVLNVAGPRESTHPGVHRRAAAYLKTVLAVGMGAKRRPRSDHAAGDAAARLARSTRSR